MQPTLQVSKLVATLKERSRRDDHAAALFGIIRPIADDVTPMLEFIRHDLEKYLLHTFGYPSVNIRFIDWDYLDLLHASATTHKTLLPEQVEVFGWVENFLRTFRGDLAGMFNRVALVAAALGKNLQKDKKVNPGQPPANAANIS